MTRHEFALPLVESVLEIPRPGADSVTAVFDRRTQEVLVIDCDGEEQLRLPSWLSTLHPEQLKTLVVTTLAQIEARARAARKWGRADLRRDLASLLGLAIAEEQA